MMLLVLPAQQPKYQAHRCPNIQAQSIILTFFFLSYSCSSHSFSQQSVESSFEFWSRVSGFGWSFFVGFEPSFRLLIMRCRFGGGGFESALWESLVGWLLLVFSSSLVSEPELDHFRFLSSIKSKGPGNGNGHGIVVGQIVRLKSWERNDI